MKSVTTTDLRNDAPGVYNEVAIDRVVKITHRDRGDMFLLSDSELRSLLRQDGSEEGNYRDI